MNQGKPADPPLTLIQLSDPHLYADPTQRLLNVDTHASLTGVLSHLRRHEPAIDLLLATGDITQDGSPCAHRRFLALCQPLSPRLAGLPGNHDQGDSFQATWQAHAQPVLDLGQWRIILLDTRVAGSNAGHLAADQLELLHASLQQAGEQHILVALHHNPVPMGSAWLDTMMIDNADHLFDILARCPRVRALLWGHVHQEHEQTLVRSPFHDAPGAPPTWPQGLRLMSAPSTCIQFTPHSQRFSLDPAAPGYRRLQLHADGTLETQVVRVHGLDLQPKLDSQGY